MCPEGVPSSHVRWPLQREMASLGRYAHCGRMEGHAYQTLKKSAWAPLSSPKPLSRLSATRAGPGTQAHPLSKFPRVPGAD